MQYNDADLRTIIDSDFILNPLAFTAGRRNDDVVDSMVICFALDIDWMKVWEKHLENNPKASNDWPKVIEHVARVSNWLEDKERYQGYNRGEHDIMVYSINY